MTTQTNFKTTKTNEFLKVPFELIEVEDGFNARKDYGDIETLAKNILEIGLIKPLELKPIENGKFSLIDGHRRHLAVKYLIDSNEIETFVFNAHITKNISKESAIINMIVSAGGKSLTAVEKAEAVKRLSNCGLKQKEISAKTGMHQSEISNYLVFTELPTILQNIVKANVLPLQNLLTVHRDNENNEAKTIEFINFQLAEKNTSLDIILADFETAVIDTEKITSADADNKTTVKTKPQDDKKKNILTSGDLNKSKNKSNNYLKWIIENRTKEQIKPEYQNLYKFFTDITNNVFSKEDLLKMLCTETPEVVEDSTAKPA